MTKVYQCDRCKTIFEPRVLVHGEPYIARKGKADLDLCPNCYNAFTDFINAISPGRASYVDYHTITVLEDIRGRLLPSMTEEDEALNKTIKAMRNEPFLAEALNKAHAEIKEMNKHIEELYEERSQDNWIPVSEGLPEINKEVIVTDIEVSTTYTSRYIGNGYWECDNGSFKDRIIAWQEKPKTYKETDNEQQSSIKNS